MAAGLEYTRTARFGTSATSTGHLGNDNLLSIIIIIKMNDLPVCHEGTDKVVYMLGATRNDPA